LTLSQVELDDLTTWLHFLDNARTGISMNPLTHRTPTNIGISDSCPYGLGGFTWHGRAWRLCIPPESLLYGLHTANNALEFLAMVVTVWLMVIESPEQFQCFLGLGDSTSVIGWLFHSVSLKGNSSYTVAVTIILSFVVLVLRTMESSMTPSAKQPSSAKTGHGVGGSVSATPPESNNHSSIVFPSRNNNYSSVHSSPLTGQQIGPTLFRGFDNIDPSPNQ
jgi:hypothetical protein